MWTETPDNVALYLGPRLPYWAQREPYVIGRRFVENL